MTQEIKVGLKLVLDIMTVINKRGLIVAVVALGIVLSVWAIYKISTFSLFDSENTEITEITIPNKDYKLKLYHVPSNATSQSYIQVRKIENEKEYVLRNYERYNYVVSHAIKNETLELVLKDTAAVNIKVDTVYVKLE